MSRIIGPFGGATAPTFSAVGAIANVGASPLVITPPAVTVGQLELAIIYAGGGRTVTAPSGWSVLASNSSQANVSLWVLAHLAASGDPATWSFTTSGAAAGLIIVYSNAMPVATPTMQATEATTATPPAGPTWSANSLVVEVFGFGANISASITVNHNSPTTRYNAITSGTLLIADYAAGLLTATNPDTAGTTAGLDSLGCQVVLAS